MPRCRFEACSARIQAGYFCREHYDVLLERSMTHLGETDARFLLDHFDGCAAEVVADHLGVSVDGIDHLLTYQMETMIFGGPKQFLDQRKLIRVLCHQDGLRYVDEENARREAREAPLDEWEPPRRVKAPQLAEPITPPEPSVSQEPETIVSADEERDELELEEIGLDSQPVPKKHYNREPDELSPWDVACLLETSDMTVRNWMIEGLLVYEERPLGSKGRKMLVTKLEDVVAFVRSCFGNHRFVRYGQRFTRFLQTHADHVSA